MIQKSSGGLCRRDHRTQVTRAAIKNIDDSQRSFWRHKCAACAYEQGVADGMRRAAAEVTRLADASGR